MFRQPSEGLQYNLRLHSNFGFSYSRFKIKTKDKIGSLIDSNGDTVTDNGTAANLLNDLFPSLFNNESVDTLP